MPFRIPTVVLTLGAMAAVCAVASAQTFTNSTTIPIPDGNAAGIMSPIVVPAGLGTITDVNVELDIEHTWVGDLIIDVESAQGTTVVLTDRPGRPPAPNGNFQDLNGIYTFDDSATGPLPEIGMLPMDIPPGSYQPEGSLATLNGEDPTGMWTLSISDNAGADTGTLNSWSLILQVQAGDTTGSDLIAALPTVDFQIMEQFLQTIGGHLNRFETYSTRTGVNNFAALPQRSPGDIQYASFSEEDSWTVRGQSPDCCGGVMQDWTGWAYGYGTGADVESLGMVDAFGYSYGGGAFGAQNWFSDQTLLGFAFGYTDAHLSDMANTASANTETYQVGVYGLHADECDNYLLGIAAYSYTNYETTRVLPVVGAAPAVTQGSTEGHSGAGYVEAGTRRCWGCWEVQPLVGLQYIYLDNSVFAETGAAGINQAFLSRDTDSLRGSAGVRVMREYCTRIGWIQPEVRARYAREFLDSRRFVQTQLVGAPQFGTLSIEGANLGRNFGIFGCGLSGQLTCRLQVYAGYDAVVSDRHVAHSGNGGVMMLY